MTKKIGVMGRPVRFTDEELRVALEECDNLAEVGRRFGVSTNAVGKRVRLLGLPPETRRKPPRPKKPRSPRRPPSPQLRRVSAVPVILLSRGQEMLIEAVVGRRNVTEVARALGVSATTVNRILNGNERVATLRVAATIEDEFFIPMRRWLEPPRRGR